MKFLPEKEFLPGREALLYIDTVRIWSVKVFKQFVAASCSGLQHGK